MGTSLTGFHSTSYFPPITQQLLGLGLQTLQTSSAFTSSSLLNEGMGFDGLTGRTSSVFSLADPGMLNNIDPFTAV